jgi:hypothetical protein
MAYNALQYRPNVKPTEQVHTLIAPGHCWHFDAWLFEYNGGLALLTETRAGGRDLLTANAYTWDGERLKYLNATGDELRQLPTITVQDRQYISRAGELNAMHRRVLEMAARVPSGFRSRSVALHYVRAPSLAPFDGTEVNLHQYGTE